MSSVHKLGRLTLALHLVLMAGLLLWSRTPAAVLLVLPLAAALPGLWKLRAYTYRWLSLVLVFYVGGLLAEGVAQPGRRGIAFALAAVGAGEFVLLPLFLRILSRVSSVPVSAPTERKES